MNPQSALVILLGWCPRLGYAGSGRRLPNYAFPASLTVTLLALGYIVVSLIILRVGLSLGDGLEGFVTYGVVYLVGVVFSRFTVLFWYLRNVKIPDIDWRRFSMWVALQIAGVPVGIVVGSMIYLSVGVGQNLGIFFTLFYFIWAFTIDRLYGTCYSWGRGSDLRSAKGEDLSAAFRD